MRKMSQEEAFLEAFESHADALFRHCYFRISDRERARELVQDVFTKVWEYLVSGKNIDTFRPFLYRTLNNLIIDEYRKKKSISLESLFDDGVVDEGAFSELSTDEDTRKLRTFDVEQLRRVVEELSIGERQVVTLRFFDGFTPREISKLLNVSANAVSVRINRAVKKLRERID